MEVEKISKIVFLDFDGVMTSVKNGTSFLCCNIEKYHIDEECKKNIEKLQSIFPDMKIVLSTAWLNRGDFDDPTPNWPWKGYNMPTPLPELHKWLVEKNLFYGNVSAQRKDEFGEHISKYVKIKKWLKEHNNELADDFRAVVLDDDASDYNNLRAIDKLDLERKGKIRFFQINYEFGFSESDLEEVKKHFSKQV